MQSSKISRVVRPSRERFRPYVDTDTFASVKLGLSKASRLLSTTDAFLFEGEVVRFISPASCWAPLADYVAVTDFRLLVGRASNSPPLALPLNEISINSGRNFNSWSVGRDTLIIDHGSQVYKIAKVPPPDHEILRDLVERGRKIAVAAQPDIFEKLTTAREAVHPPTSRPAPPRALQEGQTSIAKHTDMGAAITQLKQLNELRESGALSLHEFELAKQRIGFK